MRRLRWLSLIVIAIFITNLGCSSTMTGEAFQATKPQFDLEAFFTGEVKGWGVLQSRSGKIIQRFTVDITGTVENDTLTLSETFQYDIGSGPKTREWNIHLTPSTPQQTPIPTTENTTEASHLFSATANDVLGTAVGRHYGNAMNWQYRMKVPIGGMPVKVSVDDWMWAVDQDTLMNRSYITKWGIKLAEVTIFIQKSPLN